MADDRPALPVLGPPARRLGGPAFGLLAVTVVTGIALAPFYRPESSLQSVEGLLAGVPLGWWIRAAHAYSAWGLLGIGLLHVGDVLVRRVEGRASALAWWRWALLLPVMIAALLGGFVLRGDAEALAALAVWRGVLESVPGAGGGLAELLLGRPGGGLGTVLAHHAGTFTLLAWVLSMDHVRRPWPEARDIALAGVLTLVAAAAVPLPLGPASVEPGRALVGPWYLVGIQGMLLDLPVETAWVALLVAIAAVGAARHPRLRRGAIAVLAAIAVAGGAWSVRLLVR